MKRYYTTALILMVAAFTTLTSCRKSDLLVEGSVKSEIIHHPWDYNVIVPSDDMLTHDTVYYSYHLLMWNNRQLGGDEAKKALSDPGLNYFYETDQGPLFSPFKRVMNSNAEAFTATHWRKILYGFTNKKYQRQFTSEEEIKKAAAGERPMIKMTMTDDVFYGQLAK
jgi:hypothetical protein